MSLSVAGKKVGPIGFGLLSLCRPPPRPLDEATKVMKTALESGATFWNGAEFYGSPTANSVHLLTHYFTTYPEDSKKAVISIKGCFNHATGPDNSPPAVRKSIDNVLSILDGKVFLDVFLPGRIDTKVPIEETVAVLAEYIKAGKIGGYGLSECSAASIRKAHAVHPLSMIEVELSLFSTNILTNGVAQACSELKIPIIAYSPLSRGFLTGQFNSLDDLPKDDLRRLFPRFQPDVFDLNMDLVREVEKIAKKTGYTMPQVALAWVTSHTAKLDTPIVPIPGCTTVARVKENLSPASLSEKDLDELSEILEKITVHGGRYPERASAHLDL